MPDPADTPVAALPAFLLLHQAGNNRQIIVAVGQIVSISPERDGRTQLVTNEDRQYLVAEAFDSIAAMLGAAVVK
jgi:hypothetical protein